jgi:hypothetical protein
MSPLRITVAALLLLPACRSSNDTPASDVPEAATAQAHESSLSGRILHRSPAVSTPEAPPPCVPPSPLRRAEDGGLAEVLVHLRDAASPEPSSLDLSGDGCVFRPTVAIVGVGSELVVVNEGDGLQTFHIRRLDGSVERPVQNLALPPGDAVLRYTLDRPGRYRIADDLRPWMESHVWVVASGSTAVSDEAGRFSFDPVPGPWTAELWHPRLGRRIEAVEVPADGPASLYVTWSELGEDSR